DIGEGTRGTSFGNQTTNLPAGNYIVVVTDAKECEVEGIATIAEPNELDVTIIENSLECVEGAGIALGSIVVTVDSGGTDDFSVELYYRNGQLASTSTLNPSNEISYDDEVLFDGLDYGNYTIRIVDANGCETLKEATVDTYANILIETEGTAACEIGSGTMKVTANNIDPDAPIGDGKFYFAIHPYDAPFDKENPDDPNDDWFPGEVTDNRSYTFENLDPGVTYTFVVYDLETNCEYIQESRLPVAFESQISSTIDVEHNVTCIGEGDGYADFTVSGFASDAKAIDFQVYKA